MKTCSLSEAKSSLGRLADNALSGHPTVITRGGKLLILKAYNPPDSEAFDALIDAGIKSTHIDLNETVWKQIRQKGKKLDKKAKARG